MIVVLNYRMNIATENEKALKEFFEKIGKEVNVDGNILYALGDEETFYSDERAVEEVYLEKALNDAKKLRAVLQDNFVLEGTIDTSYVAGEYMDFKISVNGDSISYQNSDWYVEE